MSSRRLFPKLHSCSRLYIPLLTDKCEEYVLDTSKAKEWQIFPAQDFVEAVKEEKEESETSATK